jgi:hypothetical protein
MEKEKILNQYFISAKELQIVTGFGINRCREIVKQARQKMIDDGYFETPKKPIVALTNYVLEIIGVIK